MALVSPPSFQVDFGPVAEIPPDPKERLDYFTRFKDLIQKGRQEIRAWHEQGAGGREVVQAHTALIDEVIRQVLQSLIRLPRYRDHALLEQFALIAVGGYGRGELNPCSDIDLLFLPAKKINKTLDGFIQEMVSVLWGIGLEIGHSVRTLRDCQALAAEDPTVRTSMVETRLLAGQADVYRKLLSSVRKNVLRKRAQEFLNEILRDKQARLETENHVGSDPEPDIKEGPGGLRDYHVALWAVAVRFGVLSFSEIGREEVVTPHEIETLNQSVDFLLRVRNELHYQTGKKTDVLSQSLQETIARNLGYAGEDGQTPVEQFMRDYFLHATNIYNISESIFQRCQEIEPTYKKVFSKLSSRDLGNGFVAKKDLLAVKQDAGKLFEDNRNLLLSVFQLCRDHDLKPDPQLKRLIRLNKHLIDAEFLEQESIRRFFLELLAHDSASALLRIMHQVGVLGRILPEFGHTHCRVQFDFYHRYTADEHALRMVRFLEELQSPHEGGLDKLSGLYRASPVKQILKLACLLHSLGNGTGGNHRQDRLEALGRRLALDPDQLDLLRFLVTHLNTMNDLAFHQDIHQPQTIHNFAGLVKTPERLDTLLLFSYAELRAVAPETWTAWKRLLLLELYHRTRNYLLHPSSLTEKPMATRASVYKALDKEMSREEIDRHLSMMLEDYLVTASSSDVVQHLRLVRQMDGKPFVLHHKYVPEGGFYDLILVAVHSPDMFKNLVGVLTARALNIHGAQIYTRKDNLAFIHLQVDASEAFSRYGEESLIWETIAARLNELYEKKTDLPKLLAGRTRLTSQSDSKAPIIPKVEIDNLLENRFTFIRIEARDHPGMLYKIAKAFSDFNIQIHRAKIACRGGRGIDVFSVSLHGRKLFHQGMQRRLKDRIISNLMVERIEDLP